MHEPSEQRILGAEDLPQRLLQIFRDLVADAEGMDVSCLDLVVTYIEEADEFKSGTYVPELHLIVRKVTDD